MILPQTQNQYISSATGRIPAQAARGSSDDGDSGLGYYEHGRHQILYKDLELLNTANFSTSSPMTNTVRHAAFFLDYFSNSFGIRHLVILILLLILHKASSITWAGSGSGLFIEKSTASSIALPLRLDLIILFSVAKSCLIK